MELGKIELAQQLKVKMGDLDRLVESIGRLLQTLTLKTSRIHTLMDFPNLNSKGHFFKV